MFQAGISWRVIDAKWDGIRDAFVGFDPPRVADYGSAEIERLLSDPRVVRSKAKIEAVIDNAQAVLELDAEHGGFARYLRSRGSFEDTVVDLKRQFRYIGDSGAYHFLYVVGEPVPPYDEWSAGSTANASRGRSPTGGAPNKRASNRTA